MLLFDILKEMGFKSTLSCASGMNYITRDSECLYMMKRYIRPSRQEFVENFARLEEKNDKKARNNVVFCLLTVYKFRSKI